MSGGAFGGWAWLTVALLFGCGSSAENVGARRPESGLPSAALAQVLREVTVPCPPPRAMSLSATDAAPRDEVFVEVLILEAPSHLVSASVLSLGTLDQLASQPDVRLLSSPHAIAGFEREVKMTLEETYGVAPQLSLQQWSLRARRAEADVTVLDLQLILRPPGVSAPLPLSLSVSSRADEPGLARVQWDHAAQRSLLVVFRQHAVHGEKDLREIFECKMWRARAASRR